MNRSFNISPSTLSRDAYRAARQGGKVIRVGDTATAAVVVAGNDTANNPVVRPQKPAKPANPAKYHTIKKGDTLGSIARKYHTTVKKLCQLNGIKSTTVLRVGRRLRVR
ncbi:MAG: LysM peptidoglycan-binding domain-containing protein [Bacteroidales bacterium]|nr:LysM peptidoglycan-binding domain-containing protein [Bacteroidales bacterium]